MKYNLIDYYKTPDHPKPAHIIITLFGRDNKIGIDITGGEETIPKHFFIEKTCDSLNDSFIHIKESLKKYENKGFNIVILNNLHKDYQNDFNILFENLKSV